MELLGLAFTSALVLGRTLNVVRRLAAQPVDHRRGCVVTYWTGPFQATLILGLINSINISRRSRALVLNNGCITESCRNYLRNKFWTHST
eukprot:1224518-Amphidinium_carterae.2